MSLVADHLDIGQYDQTDRSVEAKLLMMKEYCKCKKIINKSAECIKKRNMK